MTKEYLLIIVSVLLVFLGVVLLLEEQEDIPLLLQTTPQVYSIKKTSDTELIYFHFLSNKEIDYHLEKEAISSVHIQSGQEQFPLHLSNLVIQETSDHSYMVTISTKIPFMVEDTIIQYEEASLCIGYNNGDELSLPIGEFNMVMSEGSHYLHYTNMYATYEFINGVKTVGAVVLQLENKSTYHIEVTDISILSLSVDVHNDFVEVIAEQVDPFVSVKDRISNYSFFDIEQNTLTISFHSTEEKSLYLPLIYQEDMPYIKRFVIVVTYKINNQEMTLYIDDFPFMSSSLYTEEYEDYIKDITLD